MAFFIFPPLILFLSPSSPDFHNLAFPCCRMGEREAEREETAISPSPAPCLAGSEQGGWQWQRRCSRVAGAAQPGSGELFLLFFQQRRRQAAATAAAYAGERPAAVWTSSSGGGRGRRRPPQAGATAAAAVGASGGHPLSSSSRCGRAKQRHDRGGAGMEAST
ncbi:hypothetical protein Taro_008142, partial [Colocasia esculenta]|nr:hypothetical protein [Colocasia esculenta]